MTGIDNVPQSPSISPFDRAWDLVEQIEDRYWPQNRTSRPIADFTNALASENGEVAELLVIRLELLITRTIGLAADQAKRLAGNGSSNRSFSIEKLLEELADLQSYLITLLMRLDVNRDTFAVAVTEKMLAVRERMAEREAAGHG